MDGFYVRAAEAADIPCLTAMEEAVFSPSPWGEREIRAHIAGAGAITLLLYSSAGEAVGYAFGIALPPEGELYRIAILPDCRRGGLGRDLLTHFLDLLSGRGCTECFLEVRAQNAPARALYAACGFAEVGIRKNYYKDPRDDALVLRRG